MKPMFSICLACALAGSLSAVEIFSPAAPKWRVADLGDGYPQAGTVLDLSKSVEPDAGSKGRIIVNRNGDFAFEKEPDTPLRFRACMTTLPHLIGEKRNSENVAEMKAAVVEHVAELKRAGYNLVRLWGLELVSTTPPKNPQPLSEVFDFAIEEFRRAGIYIEFMLPYPVRYEKGKTNIETGHIIKSKMLSGDKTLLGEWAKSTTAILNRKSSLTEVKLKDDPIALSFEYANEIELGYGLVLRRGGEDAEAALEPWRKWLSEKFGNIEKLNAVWKTDFKSFGEIDAAHSIDTLQWRQFLGENAAAFQKFCRETMRKAGYRGLLNAFNFAPQFVYSALRAEASDFTALNSYYCHPYYTKGKSKGWMNNAGASVRQTSSLREIVPHFRRAAPMRLADRPAIMTEFKHCFWNKYQYEDALAFPAYAALQNFSAICDFIRAGDSRQKPIGAFTTSNNPVALANDFLAYCLFARGDVAQAKRRVEMAVPQSMLMNDPQCSAIGREQSAIPLVTGFRVSFPEIKPRIETPKPDAVIIPKGNSKTVLNDFFATTIDNPDGKFDFDKFIMSLKQNGTLPKENFSSLKKRQFESDTGEIKLFAGEGKMVVDTPRTQGAAMPAGATAKTRDLEILELSENAAVAVCSMDGKPIRKSSSLVLVFSTAALNSGMKLAENMTLAVDMGTPPALLKTGRVVLKIALKDGAKFAVYPLNTSGVRRERTAAVSGGEMFEIDTSKLGNGAAVFFEIAEEK